MMCYTPGMSVVPFIERDTPTRRGLRLLVRRIKAEPSSSVDELSDGLPIPRRRVVEAVNILAIAGVVKLDRRVDRDLTPHLLVTWRDG
jgi:hypothetical protein